jgi:hypothetical protein
MKLTLWAKSIRTIGLITILSTIQAMSLAPTAQAQINSQNRSVCTAAYFNDPGYMYQPVTQQQRKAIEQFEQNPKRVKKWESFIDEARTFSVPLDSPMGYVVKTINGKPVTIPEKIEQAIKQAVYVDPAQNSRKRVAELNQQYGEYATFGQNITLILPLEKTKEYNKMIYESLAYIASVMTPQQRQAERDRRTAAGDCSYSSIYQPNGPLTLTIDTGRRPDLDRRVRENKTGNTFFQ